MDRSDWNIVRSIPMFESMSDEVVSVVLKDCRPRTINKGQLLFAQGAPAVAFYVVLDGWVKVFRVTPDGEEAVLGVFSRGETFAEAVVLIDGLYPACAEVITPSRLLRIGGHQLRAKIREEPDLAFSMLASTYRHLRLLVEQIEQIKVLPGPRRVAQFLVQLCPLREGTCVVGLPYEKALIANRLGMKPESLSRALAKLRNLGVVVERDHVAISECRKLKHFAETGELGVSGLTPFHADAL